MKMIRIKQTSAQIAIESRHARLEIKQNRPDVEFNRQNATFKQDVAVPTFKTQQNVLNFSGNPTQLGYQFQNSERGWNNAKAMTERISGEGDQMMRIENGGDALKNIVLNNANSETEVQLSLHPTVSNQIMWDPGKFSIEWSQAQFNAEWTTHTRAEMAFTPAEMSIYMLEWPSMEITVVDPKAGGNNVDARI